MGQNLATTIKSKNEAIDGYITNIPRTRNSLVIRETTPREVEKIIQLRNKMSSGHDSISNVLLKQLSEVLSFPLSIIFNTSIYTGTFLGAYETGSNNSFI